MGGEGAILLFSSTPTSSPTYAPFTDFPQHQVPPPQPTPTASLSWISLLVVGGLNTSGDGNCSLLLWKRSCSEQCWHHQFSCRFVNTEYYTKQLKAVFFPKHLQIFFHSQSRTSFNLLSMNSASSFRESLR